MADAAAVSPIILEVSGPRGYLANPVIDGGKIDFNTSHLRRGFERRTFTAKRDGQFVPIKLIASGVSVLWSHCASRAALDENGNNVYVDVYFTAIPQGQYHETRVLRITDGIKPLDMRLVFRATRSIEDVGRQSTILSQLFDQGTTTKDDVFNRYFYAFTRNLKCPRNIEYMWELCLKRIENVCLKRRKSFSLTDDECKDVMERVLDKILNQIKKVSASDADAGLENAGQFTSWLMGNVVNHAVADMIREVRNSDDGLDNLQNQKDDEKQGMSLERLKDSHAVQPFKRVLITETALGLQAAFQDGFKGLSERDQDLLRRVNEANLSNAVVQARARAVEFITEAVWPEYGDLLLSLVKDNVGGDWYQTDEWVPYPEIGNDDRMNARAVVRDLLKNAEWRVEGDRAVPLVLPSVGKGQENADD